MAGDEEEPQAKPNLLKPKRLRAKNAASDAVDALSYQGGNPLSGAGSSITDGAWESPDAAAFVTDLTGIGSTVRTAFVDAESHLETEWSSEPETVLVPGPEAWKADAGQIAGRVP